MGLGSQRQLDPDRILFALDPVILGESGAQFARLGPDDRTVPGVEAGVPAEHRGYGLVDSPKVRLAPGQNRALTTVLAPSARAAAQYYPASYWYSLIQIPPESDFPGTGPQGTESVPRWRPSTTGSIRSKTATSVTSLAIRQRGRARRLSALLPPASTPGTAGFRSDRMGRA
jgi:hypothetical protein